jgi:nitroreductase
VQAKPRTALPLSGAGARVSFFSQWFLNFMDVKEAFRKRRSIRKFSSKPVSDSSIEEIVWAASLAPTARNVQPWEFVVVKDPKTIKEISRLTSPNGALIAQAAACLIVFSQDTKYYLEDGCAATTQALLCATSLGLGSCWIAGDKKDYCQHIKNLLNVPDNYKLISLIALGFASESPDPAKRDFKTLIHKERF